MASRHIRCSKIPLKIAPMYIWLFVCFFWVNAINYSELSNNHVNEDVVL